MTVSHDCCCLLAGDLPLTSGSQDMDCHPKSFQTKHQERLVYINTHFIRQGRALDHEKINVPREVYIYYAISALRLGGSPIAFETARAVLIMHQYLYAQHFLRTIGCCVLLQGFNCIGCLHIRAMVVRQHPTALLCIPGIVYYYYSYLPRTTVQRFPEECWFYVNENVGYLQTWVEP